jgi:hypothetical protein
MTRARGKQGESPRWRGKAGPGELVRRLLAWYDTDGRDLAWRRRDGRRPDPYRVWLSEIMLQQTTVIPSVAGSSYSSGAGWCASRGGRNG